MTSPKTASRNITIPKAMFEIVSGPHCDWLWYCEFMYPDSRENSADGTVVFNRFVSKGMHACALEVLELATLSDVRGGETKPDMLIEDSSD